MAMVFQSYALYPHMSVEQEPEIWPRKTRKLPKSEIEHASRKRAAEILQIEHLLARRQWELSSGQSRRVAIGRAIVKRAEKAFTSSTNPFPTSTPNCA